MSCASLVSASCRGDAALAGARRGCGVVAGARSSGARPGDPGEGGGGPDTRVWEREPLRWLWWCLERLLVGENGRKVWPGKRAGASGCLFSLGFGGLGEAGVWRKGTRSADRPQFERAGALGRLGRLGPREAGLCGLEGPRVRPSLWQGLRELRRGNLLCCSLTLCRVWFSEEGSWRPTVEGWGCWEQSALWSRGPERAGFEAGARGCASVPARGNLPGRGGRAGSRQCRQICGFP